MLNKQDFGLCQVLGQHWSAMRACSASPGSRAYWQITNFFWLLPSPPADETACTQQPHLTPGCCLHTVSSSYVIVACSPLTPLLCTVTIQVCTQTRASHPRYHHLKGLWSWPPPWTLIAHKPIMGSLFTEASEGGMHGLYIYKWKWTTLPLSQRPPWWRGSHNNTVHFLPSIYSTPSHSLEPIVVTHRIRWTVVMTNLDSHMSELCCLLSLHVLDHALLHDMCIATCTTCCLFGLNDM